MSYSPHTPQSTLQSPNTSHTYLTSYICNNISIWHHTIRNACQDRILLHPLHNPITIINIHYDEHFATFVTNNQTYHYYYPPRHTLPPLPLDTSTLPYVNGTPRHK